MYYLTDDKITEITEARCPRLKLKKEGSERDRCGREARSKFVVQLMPSISAYLVMEVKKKKQKPKPVTQIVLLCNPARQRHRPR